MPGPRQAGDFAINGKPFMLARGELRGRAWQRAGAPDTAARRSDEDTKFGLLPDDIEFTAVYSDFSGGFGHAYRRQELPDVVHWSENLDLRFPKQAVHCQQLQLLPFASTNSNCEYLIDVPLPGVANPPVGAGAVLAVGKGFVTSYAPTHLRTTASMFNRLYEATGGGAITFGRRPATFGSFTYIPVVDGSAFFRRSNDGLAYTIGPNQPAQVFLNSGDRLSFFWKSLTGAHMRTVLQGADPLGTANYSATISVGPGHLPPMDAVDRDRQVFVGMANGVHAGDSSGTFVNVMPDLADQQHADNARDLCIYNTEVQIPHVSGLWSFHPSQFISEANETGPAGRGDRSPVRGRVRAVKALGPWLYAGLWTGSQSYILARSATSDVPKWHVMHRLPATSRVHRIHFDGITTASGGREISQRMWIATDASLAATAPIMVSPIPRGNDNPLAIDPTFSANFVGSARVDFGRDDRGAPGTPKVYRAVEIWADNMASGCQYADVYYAVDGGSRVFLGRAVESPKSTIWFQGVNGDFVTGQDIELSLESYTTSLSISPVYRSVVVRGAIRPNVVDQVTAVARIADGMRDRNSQLMRSASKQIAELRSHAATVNPVYLNDITGAGNWVLVRPGIEERELYQEVDDAPEIAATIRMAVLDFTGNQFATWDQIATRTWATIANFTWEQVASLPG